MHSHNIHELLGDPDSDLNNALQARLVAEIRPSCSLDYFKYLMV